MNTMSGCHFSPPQQVNSDRSNSYSGSIQNPRPVHSNTFDFKPEKGDPVRAALRPLAGALVEQPADLDDLMVCSHINFDRPAHPNIFFICPQPVPIPFRRWLATDVATEADLALYVADRLAKPDARQWAMVVPLTSVSVKALKQLA